MHRTCRLCWLRAVPARREPQARRGLSAHKELLAHKDQPDFKALSDHKELSAHKASLVRKDPPVSEVSLVFKVPPELRALSARKDQRGPMERRVLPVSALRAPPELPVNRELPVRLEQPVRRACRGWFIGARTPPRPTTRWAM